jgi:hypothetical protein
MLSPICPSGSSSSSSSHYSGAATAQQQQHQQQQHQQLSNKIHNDGMSDADSAAPDSQNKEATGTYIKVNHPLTLSPP